MTGRYLSLPFRSDVVATLGDGIPLDGLPPGHVHHPDPDDDGSPAAGRFWTSDEALNGNWFDLWIDLAARFPETGLWPISTTLGPAPAEFAFVSDPSTAAEKAEEIVERLSHRHKDLGLFEFPSQMRPIRIRARHDPTLRGPVRVPDVGLVAETRHNLGLVAVDRPANVFSIVEADYAFYFDDIGELPWTPLIASWEDRFGVIPVMVDVTSMTLLVLDPPSPLDAPYLAAELGAFAYNIAGYPDGVIPMWGQGSITFEDLTEALPHGRLWEISWD